MGEIIIIAVRHVYNIQAFALARSHAQNKIVSVTESNRIEDWILWLGLCFVHSITMEYIQFGCDIPNVVRKYHIGNLSDNS